MQRGGKWQNRAVNPEWSLRLLLQASSLPYSSVWLSADTKDVCEFVCLFFSPSFYKSACVSDPGTVQAENIAPHSADRKRFCSPTLGLHPNLTCRPNFAISQQEIMSPTAPNSGSVANGSMTNGSSVPGMCFGPDRAYLC